MAAIAAAAGTSAALGGVSSSSIQGQKLAVQAVRPVAVRSHSSVGVATAKYEKDKSLYFDLGDINNTTGNWDLYGSDAPSPYNGFQSKFFETFGGVFSKRGLLLKFLVLGGAGALGYASSTASGDFLPIKKGPQDAPAEGPRGRI